MILPLVATQQPSPTSSSKSAHSWTLQRCETTRLALSINTPGIELVYAPHADSGCGSGYYRPDPPTIYLHSSLYRRNAFTVLHELAHHLQRHHNEWGFHLMDIRDTNHRLRIEEIVCDRFAAKVLLPAERISDDALCHPADAMAGLYVSPNLSHSAAIQSVAASFPPHARWIWP